MFDDIIKPLNNQRPPTTYDYIKYLEVFIFQALVN
jgi:hypothetical protein